MSRQLRNSRLTSSGNASVATSKSLGLKPKEQIAHGAAHEKRLISRLFEPV